LTLFKKLLFLCLMLVCTDCYILARVFVVSSILTQALCYAYWVRNCRFGCILTPILGEHEELTSAPVSRCVIWVINYVACYAYKMSNGAINPPLVVIHAFISKLRRKIYDFILYYVNRSLLTTQSASLNISLFLTVTSSELIFSSF